MLINGYSVAVPGQPETGPIVGQARIANLANILTGLRLVLVPIFMFALFYGGGHEVASRLVAFVIFTIASGCGIFQPVVQTRGAGASCGSPAGAFAFDQAASVAISSVVSDGSFAKCPMLESANHGGIFRLLVMNAIDRAPIRACS